LQDELQQPDFIDLLHQFLYNQLHPLADAHVDLASDILPHQLPEIHGKISVYPSAVATFFAPSDICGIGGMHREHIRALPSWRRGPARYDCILVNTDPSAQGMRGLEVARVWAFLSFKSQGVTYPCALIHWFSRVDNEPDEDTGMWIVEPDYDLSGSPFMAIIHLDSVLRAAHLLGVCGKELLPKYLTHNDSLDAFHSFYVNKFIDHHAFEVAF
jgi:hypothetical protein